jgi:hydroxypyruvate isomerase
VIFCLENLNTAVDHPGTPFAKAADTLALVAAVDSPHLRLMLDIYHAQIGEGNLVELINKCAPYIGEVQVADVPGSCEPGTGEINYPCIAQALRDNRLPRHSRHGSLGFRRQRGRTRALPSCVHS